MAEGIHKIKVNIQNDSGTVFEQEVTNIKVMASGGVVGVALPYPNPYDPQKGNVLFTYNLAVDSDVTIYLFDVNGRFLWKNSYSKGANGGKAGYNEVAWNGLDAFGRMLDNDIYLIRIVESTSGRILGKGKLMVLKGVSARPKKEDSKISFAMVMISMLGVGLVALNGMIRMYRAVNKIKRRK